MLNKRSDHAKNHRLQVYSWRRKRRRTFRFRHFLGLQSIIFGSVDQVIIRAFQFRHFPHFPQVTQGSQGNRPVGNVLVPARRSEKRTNMGTALPLVIKRKSADHLFIIVQEISGFKQVAGQQVFHIVRHGAIPNCLVRRSFVSFSIPVRLVIRTRNLIH